MTNHQLWNEIGNLYTLAGAYEPAIHAYSKASQMNSRWGRPICNLAMIYAQVGNIDDAISLLKKGLDLLPDSIEKAIDYNKLGFLYSQNNDFDQALEAYHQANILFSKAQRREGSELPSFSLHFQQSLLDIQLPSKSGQVYPLHQIIPTDLQDDIATINSILETCELDALDFENFDFNLSMLDTTNITSKSMTLTDDTSTYSETLNSIDIDDKSNVSSDIIAIREQSITTDQPLPFNNSELDNACPETIHETASIVSDENVLIDVSGNELEILEQELERCKLQTKNNPRSIYAWEKLSDYHKSAGQYKAAAEAIQTAISINPNKPSSHYRLGLIHAVEHRDAEAVYEFKTALELNPNHSQAHASLAGQYFNMQLDELGEYHIKRAIDSGFDNDSEYNRACLEAIRGNKSFALDLLQVALETKQTYVNWIKADPDLDTLRDEERYQKLLMSHSLNE